MVGGLVARDRVVHRLDARGSKENKNTGEGSVRIQTVMAEISVGELIDKITILEIKQDRIDSAQKLTNINTELDALNKLRQTSIPETGELSRLEQQLKAVNEDLWGLEDNIRFHEKSKNFGETFVKLARSVYRTNDKRSNLKREINRLMGSSIIEEKSYEDY